jgi:hypothetical protein
MDPHKTITVSKSTLDLIFLEGQDKSPVPTLSFPSTTTLSDPALDFESPHSTHHLGMVATLMAYPVLTFS